ncbi:hypothetical protein HKD37_05G013841 [Glycine soja]
MSTTVTLKRIWRGELELEPLASRVRRRLLEKKRRTRKRVHCRKKRITNGRVYRRKKGKKIEVGCTEDRSRLEFFKNWEVQDAVVEYKCHM